jgi:RNA polymerase sigma-70 factor (ECF subfamily)
MHPAQPVSDPILLREAETPRGGARRLRRRAGRAVGRNNHRLFRLARSILRDDAEADDVMQESYLRAFTALEGFKGDAALGIWLSRIVVNEALGRLRRRRPTIDLDDLCETTAATGARQG